MVRSLGTRGLWSEDLYQLTDEDFGALNFKPGGALVTYVNDGAHRKPFSNRNLDAMLPEAPPTRTVVFIGGAFRTYLPWIQKAECFERTTGKQNL